jgi:hypothetical protein
MRMKACLVIGIAYGLYAPVTVAQSQPLSVRVSLEKPAHLGQDITLKVEIRNISSKEVTFDHSVGSGQADYRIVLSEEDGERIYRTTLGRALAYEFSGPDDPAREIILGGSYALESLKPQETFVDTFKLNDVYDIEKPGKYTVQLEREGPSESSESGGWLVRSNVLAFMVEK